jgi:hypothetical protein
MFWHDQSFSGKRCVLAAALLVTTVFPAFAASSITTSETSSLQSSLTAAIHAANGSSMAIENAISLKLQGATAANGADAAGSITSAIIAISEAAGASRVEIGAGLGQGAVALAQPSCRGENGNALVDCQVAPAEISLVVANEADRSEVSAFSATVTSLGFPKLAILAGQSIAPTAETGGIGNGNVGGGFVGSTASGGGGCRNPSCTSL